jgi:hypothetical protein
MSLMTLANMRANGVRNLAVWCLGRGCNHFRVLDVSGYPDEMPVPHSVRACAARNAVTSERKP